MNKWLTILWRYLAAACLIFTSAVTIYMIVAYCLGLAAVKLPILFSLLLIALFGSLCQLIAYTDLVFKNMSYAKRIIIFALPFFIILTAIALTFDWFPRNLVGAWLSFVLIFVAMFIIISLGYEVYFRLKGYKYNDLLKAYKKTKK